MNEQPKTYQQTPLGGSVDGSEIRRSPRTYNLVNSGINYHINWWTPDVWTIKRYGLRCFRFTLKAAISSILISEKPFQVHTFLPTEQERIFVGPRHREALWQVLVTKNGTKWCRVTIEKIKWSMVNKWVTPLKSDNSSPEKMMVAKGFFLWGRVTF